MYQLKRTIKIYLFKILFNVSIKNKHLKELLKFSIVIQFDYSTYQLKRTIEIK